MHLFNRGRQLENEEEYILVYESEVSYGKKVRRLRRVDGKLKIVRKRKKALPLSMRTVSLAKAKRRAKKSAIKRKASQKRITRKVLKTKKRAVQMGLGPRKLK